MDTINNDTPKILSKADETRSLKSVFLIWFTALLSYLYLIGFLIYEKKIVEKYKYVGDLEQPVLSKFIISLIKIVDSTIIIPIFLIIVPIIIFAIACKNSHMLFNASNIKPSKRVGRFIIFVMLLSIIETWIIFFSTFGASVFTWFLTPIILFNTLIIPMFIFKIKLIFPLNKFFKIHPNSIFFEKQFIWEIYFLFLFQLWHIGSIIIKITDYINVDSLLPLYYFVVISFPYYLNFKIIPSKLLTLGNVPFNTWKFIGKILGCFVIFTLWIIIFLFFCGLYFPLIPCVSN